MSQKADEVFQDLQRRIMADELEAGDRLPSERELATEYGATRNTLREALRRLEQVGLVSVRAGAGVTVSDFRRTAGLDILTPFLEHGSDMREKALVIVDLLQARIQAFDYAHQLAIERAHASDLRRIERITHSLLDAFEAGDRVVLARGFGEWLEALVDSAHSLPAQWIANPFLELNRNLMERFPGLWVLDPSFPSYLQGCLQALIERDAEMWRSVTTAYYERVDAVILESLAQLLPGGQADSEDTEDGGALSDARGEEI